MVPRLPGPGAAARGATFCALAPRRSSLDTVAAGCEGEAMDVDVLRYAAFTDDPASGNPAGVVPDAGQLTERDMLGIAAGVGYSETAFVTGSDQQRRGLYGALFQPARRGPVLRA